MALGLSTARNRPGVSWAGKTLVRHPHPDPACHGRGPKGLRARGGLCRGGRRQVGSRGRRGVPGLPGHTAHRDRQAEATPDPTQKALSHKISAWRRARPGDIRRSCPAPQHPACRGQEGQRRRHAAADPIDQPRIQATDRGLLQLARDRSGPVYPHGPELLPPASGCWVHRPHQRQPKDRADHNRPVVTLRAATMALQAPFKKPCLEVDTFGPPGCEIFFAHSRHKVRF